MANGRRCRGNPCDKFVVERGASLFSAGYGATEDEELWTLNAALLPKPTWSPDEPNAKPPP